MAVTQNSYTGNGSTTNYSFTFPYLKSTEVKASIDATVTTAFTLANATTVQFNTAPASGAKIKIYRETDTSSLAATFYAGSAIKSEDLNDNFTQNLYTTQEVSARYLSNLGGNMVGDLTLGEDVVIKFEGATDNDFETTLTVTDPTADRTITLPNVTGTVLTTGSTGAVTTAIIAADAVTGAKIADDSIDSEHIVADSLDTEHYAPSSVDTTALAADAVTSAKISNNAINSEHYVDGSIDREHLAADIVDGTKIADDAINSEHYAADSIDSEHYAPGSVDATALASNSVTQVKLADDAVGANELATNAVVTDSIVDNAVTLAKMADNSVGSAELINDSVTNAKIANDQIDSEHYVDGSIDTAHIGDDQITNAKIATDAVNADSIAANAVGASELANNAVDTAAIADNAVTSAKIAANAVTTTEIADAELTTLAGMQSGTASKLASSTALTADIADLNQIDGLTKQTTISDSDASFPTSGAVVDYVSTQISGLGGLTVIANDASFPNTQPDSGLVISIADAGGLVINGSGTSTTARTVGGSTVTINNINSQFNSSTLAAGIAMMVTSTGSGQIYNYHKATLKESDIVNLSTDINDFSNRYRVANSAPTSDNDAGDLYFNTTSNKLFTYNGTDSAWEEAQSIGNFYINTISSYSGTGGNSATFNGSAYRFVLSNAPANAQQLLVSINGVIQKPNSGTSQPSEGFVIDGSSIIFSNAPATGSDYFIITIGSSVNTGTPSDNTVSTAVIQNLAVTGDKIANDTITEVKLDIHQAPSDGKFLKYTSSNGMEWGDVPAGVGGATGVDFNDNVKARFGTGNDLEIYHDGSNSYLDNSTGIILQRCDDIRFHNAAGSENLLVAKEGSYVSLYYDGTKKFETTANGITVAGNGLFSGNLETSEHLSLTADNKKIKIGAGEDLQIYHDGSDSYIDETGTGGLNIKGSGIRLRGVNSVDLSSHDNNENMLRSFPNGSVDLYYDNVKKFETTSTGISVTGSDTTGSIFKGDIRLKKTTDDDTQIKWDASHVMLELMDGVKARFGTQNDFDIYHDGSNSYIENVTGNVYFRNDGAATYYQMGSSNESAIVTAKDDYVGLFFDGTQRLGTTGNGVQISGDVSASSQCLRIDNSGSDGSNRDFIRFKNSSGTTAGSIQHSGSTSVSYNTSSDYRLKENEIPISDGITRLKTLKPYRFNFKSQPSKTVDGFFAHEVTAVPEAISGKKDGTEMQSLDYSKLTPLLTAALQEAITKIETLETKVAALEAK